MRSKKLTSTPYIEMLEGDNVRSDFWEGSEFEAVRDQMPEHLRGLITLHFWSAWRVRPRAIRRDTACLPPQLRAKPQSRGRA